MKTLLKTLLTGFLLCGLITPVVQAEPPPWAPAHGYRNKNKHKHDDDYYRADRGRYYYGIPNGRCNREEIGTVLGGAVGGAIGRNTADDKTVGTIAGVIIGAVVGNIIGRSMDEADRYCTGHVLEYAEDHQTVSWETGSDQRYRVTPINTYQDDSAYCRDFTVTEITPRGTMTNRQTACRVDDGQWRMMR